MLNYGEIIRFEFPDFFFSCELHLHMKISDSWEGHMCSLNYLKAPGSNLEVLFYLNQHSLIVYACLHFILDLMIKYQLSKNGNNDIM